MTDITIPPEALEALAMAILEITGEGIDMDEARAACLAMLKAWPGSYSLAENDSAEIRDVAVIILPLTTENTND